MESAPLSLGEVLRFALELTALILAGSALVAALVSALLLMVAGVVTEGLPRMLVRVRLHRPALTHNRLHNAGGAR